MDRHALFLLVLGVATVNGLFSPYLTIAVPIVTALLPEVFPRTLPWVLFFSSVFVATTTLLVGGVPAAIYERLARPGPEATAAMWIWLAAALLMSLPALGPLARL